jgi:hypothetical protein
VARAPSLAFLLGVAGLVFAEPPVIVPCDALPPAVAALGVQTALDAYGVAPAASVAVAASPSPGDDGRSVLWFSTGGEAARAVKLAGRVMGLAVLEDGTSAFAVVRATDRKGAVRTVELTRVDLKTGRVSSAVTLPATARGLAIGAGGKTLLVASRDEIRTFQLPDLSSGRMYRAVGENVGVAPIAGSSTVVVARPTHVVLADLAGAQGRDGLSLGEEAAAPARFSGMISSTADGGAIALAEGGTAWCVRAEAPPPPPASVAAAAPAPDASPAAQPEVQPEAPPAMQTPPAEPPPAEAAPADSPAAAAPPVAAPIPPAAPAEPGSVSGLVAGPASAEVASIVFLGPDNVLHEALRVAPDGQGRFTASGLPTGSFRIVASGKGGRVLICEPPFISIRVGSNGAVEAPVLKVLRAQ